MNTSGDLGGIFDSKRVAEEFRHLRSGWIWLLLLGVLLVVCGVLSVAFPAMTVLTTFAATVVVGVSLMASGLATIVTAFWAGRWSGFLLQLLVGILYLVAGFMIAERPAASAAALTIFVAALFIVLGLFRVVAALVIRFPQWGWATLNGAVTLIVGVMIYRHFPESALWVIGLLVGVELLFHGLSWIMLSLAVRRIPVESAS